MPRMIQAGDAVVFGDGLEGIVTSTFLSAGRSVNALVQCTHGTCIFVLGSDLRRTRKVPKTPYLIGHYVKSRGFARMIVGAEGYSKEWFFLLDTRKWCTASDLGPVVEITDIPAPAFQFGERCFVITRSEVREMVVSACQWHSHAKAAFIGDWHYGDGSSSFYSLNVLSRDPDKAAAAALTM